MRGCNFDGIAGEFSRNIYGTTKGQLRQTILWQDLDRLLAGYTGQTLRVSDAGDGEGQTAILMMQRDYHVTLCDLSAEMTVRAQQATEEQGVGDDMHFIHCAAQDILQRLDSQADLILFRAVLERVADPQAVLKTLWLMLCPGGALSLIFYNADGLLVYSVLAGNLGYIQQGICKKKRCTLFPDFLRNLRQVYSWLEKIGWEITGKASMRVLHDYLRDKQKQYDCLDALTEIGTRYCRQEPYISLGRYIHVTTIKRPARAADARITYK